MAIGIVTAIVKTPHGLDLSAFTTTSATTAIRITMMTSTAKSAVQPPNSLISSFAIWPSDLPVAPHRARTASRSPARIRPELRQSRSRACRADTRTERPGSDRPAALDRQWRQSGVRTEPTCWWERNRGRRRDARRAWRECRRARARDRLRIGCKTVAQGINAHRRSDEPHRVQGFAARGRDQPKAAAPSVATENHSIFLAKLIRPTPRSAPAHSRRAPLHGIVRRIPYFCNGLDEPVEKREHPNGTERRSLTKRVRMEGWRQRWLG